MQNQLLHPADQLILMINRIYHGGMTTTSGGNLSVLDENGDIWITPGSIDKGTLTRRDIVQVKPDGTVIGIHNPSSELPFHRHMYQVRPDIRAVVHAHPPSLVAFSLARRLPDLHLFPEAARFCGPLEMAPYDLPGSTGLGDKIAKVFEKGLSCVMLENHGVVVGGKNLFEAFLKFETLDFCARIEIGALAVGTPKDVSAAQVKTCAESLGAPAGEFGPDPCGSAERALRRDLCAFTSRAYSQKLFCGFLGTYSARLGDDDFLITPAGADRLYLEPDDLVRVRGGLRQKGRIPDPSAALIRAIYRSHPEVGSVVVAAPPAIMAFAVTGAPFDSLLIPESYIVLRKVQRLPFGERFLHPEKTAALFTVPAPIVVAENDCAIVAGADMTNAFDRLEVLDYSARALLGVQKIGPVARITDKEVDDIEVAFHLK